MKLNFEIASQSEIERRKKSCSLHFCLRLRAGVAFRTPFITKPASAQQQVGAQIIMISLAMGADN